MASNNENSKIIRLWMGTSYLLRPGNADAKKGCFGLLKRVLRKLRQAFPGAVIRLRLDSGFSGPDIYEFMEALEMSVRCGDGEELGA